MFNNPFFGQPMDPNSNRPEGPNKAEQLLLGLMAALPEKARALAAKLEGDLAKIQEKVDAEAAEIRQAAENRIAKIEEAAEERRRILIEQVVDQLQPLQKDHFRTGELGEALAIFLQVQKLKAAADNVLPDPGNLLQHRQVGKSYLFEVTGDDRGPVWGSNAYTADSHLATAAVHAGAIDLDETGIVRVQIVDMARMAVLGSTSNGVTTMDWGPYDVGYRVTRRMQQS